LRTGWWFGKCFSVYPLANLYITMENHNFQWKIHYKWVIFNSYVKLPEGIGNVIIPTDELILFRGTGIPPTSEAQCSPYPFNPEFDGEH
jgi:hypothetical protein